MRRVAVALLWLLAGPAQAVSLEQVVHLLHWERMTAKEEKVFADSAAKFRDQMYPSAVGEALTFIGGWHHGVRYPSGVERPFVVLVYLDRDDSIPYANYSVTWKDESGGVAKSRWVFFTVDEVSNIDLRLLAQLCHVMGYTFSEDDDRALWAFSHQRVGMIGRTVRDSPGVVRLHLAREQSAWQMGHGLFTTLAGTTAYAEVYEPQRVSRLAEVEADLAKAFLMKPEELKDVEAHRLPAEGVVFAGKRYTEDGVKPVR